MALNGYAQQVKQQRAYVVR